MEKKKKLILAGIGSAGVSVGLLAILLYRHYKYKREIADEQLEEKLSEEEIIAEQRVREYDEYERPTSRTIGGIGIVNQPYNHPLLTS